MGLSCTNILVRDAELKTVAALLKCSGSAGFVVQFENRLVGVFDRKCEDQNAVEMADLCIRLSSDLECVVMGSAVVDGDVFLYWLYESGQLMDAYNSTPDYFSSEWGKPSSGPTGGSAEALCRAFRAVDSQYAVDAVFERARKADAAEFEASSLIGEDIHAALARALKLPEALVGVGYYAIEAGNLPAAFPTHSMLRYGA